MKKIAIRRVSAVSAAPPNLFCNGRNLIGESRERCLSSSAKSNISDTHITHIVA